MLAFSFLLCLDAIAQTAESDGSETETLRGTVVNSVTQAPIPRALVYSADNRYAVLTDGDGHFEFTVPKIGFRCGCKLRVLRTSSAILVVREEII